VSATTPGAPPSARSRTFPPVAELVTVSLGLVVVGGISMASSFPNRPPLTVPVVLLVASVALLATGVTMMARQRDFAWGTFSLVGRWALLAYVISAGMIEFAFVRNHASGAPLLVVTLMLVTFAVDVPVIIAFTVARYQDAHSA
jgi:hypothetical protein